MADRGRRLPRRVVKVVLDTNVWVSAFAAHGLCEELVRDLLVSTSDEVLSTPLVWAELHAVLVRKLKLDEAGLTAVRRLFGAARSVPDIPDDGSDADSRLVAAAMAAGADLFVTGDRGLIEAHGGRGLQIATPREAWAVLHVQ